MPRRLRLARLQAGPDQESRSDTPGEPAGQGLTAGVAQAETLAVDANPAMPLEPDLPSFAPAEASPSSLPDAAEAELASSNLVSVSAAAGGSAILGGGAPLVAFAGLGWAAGGGGGGGSGAGTGVAGGSLTHPMPVPTGPANALSGRLATDAGLVREIAAGGLTRDNTLGLSGMVVSGADVDVYDGELFLGRASVSGTHWTFLTPALADGLHTLQVRFSQAQTLLAAESLTVFVDTRTSGTLSDKVVTDAGATPSITAGGSTRDDTVGLSGTAEAGSTVQIYDGEDLLGELSLAPAASDWRYTTPALAPGSHALSAKVIDPAGNSFRTDALALTVLPGFSITFDYTGDAARYAPIFQRAATFWSSIITDDLPDYGGGDDLRIQVAIFDIDGDGAGTVAGQAQVTGVRPGSLLPYTAKLDVDSALLPMLAGDERLYDLLRHEIAHAMGFGVFFRPLGLLDVANPFHYTGAKALAQYRALTQSSATFIPLENTGGLGTAGSHWKESVFDAELMTGTLEAPGRRQPVSALTLGVLEDLGYAVDYSRAEAYALPRPLASLVDVSAVMVA